MADWLQSALGLTVEEAVLIVAVLTLLVTVPLAVQPVRSAVARVIRRMQLMARVTERKYKRWFLRQHGKLQNIYLNQIEELDLAQTYVSLSFAGPSRTSEDRLRATRVLAEPSYLRLLIVGDPGSGKSTLLNAYGTGIIRKHTKADTSDLKVIARNHEIPFIVKLRNFAKYADNADSLAKYLVTEILGKQARIKGGRDFLTYLLRRERCLILLDGLDEVPDERYDLVRSAITEFADRKEAYFPTAQSRMVLSCRRQNFLRIQTDWVPGFSQQPYVLASLLDSEIFSFILKRKRDFASPRTPDSFFAAIKASGTIELHRAPLILTISLGLYLNLVAYEIPSSIGKFYDTMINELLTRHDFRGDHTGSTNEFNAQDKYRFLREFALAMALRPGKFEDFSFREATEFAETMIPKMSHVRVTDADKFIREIVDRSGLLTRTSDEDEYVFAHRSIQEYLIATQLQRDPAEGATFLVKKASQSEWRQVTLFYAALDHQYVETLLEKLSSANLELAGNALAGASPVSDELSTNIIARLAEAALDGSSIASTLSALVSVTGAQKEAVREEALTAVSDILASFLRREDLMTVLDVDSEGALRLLEALSATNSTKIAASVPELMAAISIEDERLVSVLWRCLATAGMEDNPASVPIVARMLVMVMQPSSLKELEKQPAYVPTFVTAKMRAQVYPFERGWDPDSNLVTLLCWAHKLDVSPAPLNRFFEASKTDHEAFVNIERDHRRTFAVRPFATTRIAITALFGIALVASILLGIFAWQRIDVFGKWYITVPLYLVPGAVASLLAGLVAEIAQKATRRHPKDSRDIVRRLGFAVLGDDCANLVVGWNDMAYGGPSFFWDSDTLILCAFATVLSTPYVVVLALLAGWVSSVGWLVVATVAVWLVFWLPATELFSRESVIYFRKINPFVDVYDDPRSEHWVTADE